MTTYKVLGLRMYPYRGDLCSLDCGNVCKYVSTDDAEALASLDRRLLFLCHTCLEKLSDAARWSDYPKTAVDREKEISAALGTEVTRPINATPSPACKCYWVGREACPVHGGTAKWLDWTGLNEKERAR